MKMHRYEEIWLALSFGILIIFMLVVGYQTFAMGMGPPSHKETIDPQKVDETAPFDNPGVFQTGDNEYEVVMTLQTFGFTPSDIVVPVGAKGDIYHDVKRRSAWIPSCWNEFKRHGYAWSYSKNHADI